MTRRRWGAVAISGASLLALTVPAAQAAPAPSLSLSAAQVRRARRFWTPARMRNTRGLPAPPVGPAAFPAPADLARRRRPPRRPAGGALDRALSESVADPAAPGTSENGVLFVAGGPNRERGRCSGTSVNAPNFSVVFTAGHCVHDEGHWWARSWVFVPGYRYGERPFGTFPAHWLGTTPGWLRDENFNYDVGVAVVSRNERGQRLAEVAGADGIAWGLPPDQAFDVYGYPVAPPYDGATLQLCPQSRYIGHDLGAFLSPGPLEIGVECEVSGGSSGGGWVVSGNTLDGVTSNSYDSDPTTTFGPYFGKAVEKLFDEAARVR